MAQPQEQQSTPTKKKPAAEKTNAAEAQPGAKAAKPEDRREEPGAAKHEGATQSLVRKGTGGRA